ncbi:PTS beta-glucoside transporter subunit EIIBCA [bacterium 1XD21-13]|nr:PTS beta-glucoside transporter subunit EIIBCA [bacterium 1XD21-13]
MDAKKLAGQILKEVGGKDNIKEMFHCVTRLRFYLKDRSKVDLEKVKALDGVMGVQFQAEQFQIIIGNEVNTVYDAVIAQTGFIHTEETLEQKKKFRVTGIFETMAAILLPVIPALAGAGMIKGLITILTSYCGVDAASDAIQVLTIAGDCVFYFLPFLVAWSASKRFKTDTACSLALAGALLYPTMTAGLAEGAAPMVFLGLPIPFVKYASSSIPIILAVLVLSFVYPLVDKVIPKVLRLVFTPLFVLIIMVPLTLIGIAPLANYISKILVMIVRFLYDLSPIVAGAIVGGTRLLVVLTGMHMSLSAICLENLNQFGWDFLLPMNTMGTLALFGVCMGVMVRAKRSENKSIGASTAISAFIGITEPGIYGIILKFKNALIAAIIAGAAGGAIVGGFGDRATSFVNSCILSLPVFMGEGFWAVCLGMAVAAGLGFVLVMVMGLSEEKDEPKAEAKPANRAAVGEKKNSVIYAPVTGTLIPLEKVKDAVFSSGTMGKGIAVDPEDGVIVAPFDGTVTALYPTKHAVGITSEDGVECIIHVGVDTANLQGKHFEVKVKENQKVKAGDVLLEVDLAAIIKEGYSLVTPILVTNSDEYLDVLPNETEGMIAKSEVLLTVIK